MLVPIPLVTAALILLAALGSQSSRAPGEVLQFGGPGRDFKYEATGLRPVWPEGGPPQLWKRELGDGYSGIVARDGVIYTMYRPSDEREAVVALDAATGKTIWQHDYPAPFSGDYVLQQGPGPRATPLIAGDRLFTAGATGLMHALDLKTGKPLWSHDLIGDFGGNVRVRGYSCSPLAYGNTVIMMVGGPDRAVMAFNQSDGSVAWASGNFRNSHASPLLITVDGQDQVVAFMFAEAVGLDPQNGNLLWSHPHETDFGLNISTPVWGPDNVLFLSSAYGGGSRALRLRRRAGRTSVEELWAHRVMRVHFGTIVRQGAHVYGASGDFGPAPLTALDLKSGNVLWRSRELAKSNAILVGERLIAVDEDGYLALATATPEGLQVHAKAQVLTSVAWTPPTLVGTTLYLRDRKHILAIDLRNP